jgi:hypothetical protein
MLTNIDLTDKYRTKPAQPHQHIPHIIPQILSILPNGNRSIYPDDEFGDEIIAVEAEFGEGICFTLEQYFDFIEIWEIFFGWVEMFDDAVVSRLESPIFGEICMSESTLSDRFEDIESVVKGFADERHTSGGATLVYIVVLPSLV